MLAIFKVKKCNNYNIFGYYDNSELFQRFQILGLSCGSDLYVPQRRDGAFQGTASSLYPVQPEANVSPSLRYGGTFQTTASGMHTVKNHTKRARKSEPSRFEKRYRPVHMAHLPPLSSSQVRNHDGCGLIFLSGLLAGL